MTQLDLIDLCKFPTKQAALEAFEEARPDWLTQARQVAIAISKRESEVTIDDVRKLCPPPKDIDPRIMGAVFKGREWVPIGYANSNRSTCHKRPIRIFRWVGA